MFTVPKVKENTYHTLCWGEKAARKHLCSNVGGYGINPSPEGDVYAWLFKYLLTDFAKA